MTAQHEAWAHREAIAAANLRRAELGAQAIGVLAVLLQDGDIPSAAVRRIAQRIVDEWDALATHGRRT